MGIIQLCYSRIHLFVSSFVGLNPVTVGTSDFTLADLFFDCSEAVRLVHHISEVVDLLAPDVIELKDDGVGYPAVDTSSHTLHSLDKLFTPFALVPVVRFGFLFVGLLVLMVVLLLVLSHVLPTKLWVFDRHQSS